MPGHKDWFFRPLLRGLHRYESLKDGTLTLCDIAEMNEVLDVEDENRARAQEAAKQ